VMKVLQKPAHGNVDDDDGEDDDDNVTCYV